MKNKEKKAQNEKILIAFKKVLLANKADLTDKIEKAVYVKEKADRDMNVTALIKEATEDVKASVDSVALESINVGRNVVEAVDKVLKKSNHCVLKSQVGIMKGFTYPFIRPLLKRAALLSPRYLEKIVKSV